MALAMTNGATMTMRSALWSAYGDALGFISELTGPEGLQARLGATRVSKPVGWRRQIGGRFGAFVDLPPGCYSDDTELRLATCRSIRGDGYFDVEAFAKVELPLWLSYALGGGRSTRAAAINLAKQDVNWFSNFFAYQGVKYEEAGGNGGAMRIQPHVWAARTRGDYLSFAGDVIRNTVCTHGHPRAIAGALFHSVCVAFALEHREIPGPPEWSEFVEALRICADLIRKDGDLVAFWLPAWEARRGAKVGAALDQIASECRQDLASVGPVLDEADRFDYEGMVRAIGGLQENSRGSGIKTSIAAAVLSWAYRSSDPHCAIERSANLLYSDTDTISTMAGAILGCIADDEPRGEILDRDYIVREADRLYAISSGRRAESFQYPDLMNWQPPQSQVDAVVGADGRYALKGLGPVQMLEKTYHGRGRNEAMWQWLRLDFGQTVLAKRRAKIPETHSVTATLSEPKTSERVPNEAPALLSWHQDPQRLPERPKRQELPVGPPNQRASMSLDHLTKEVIRADFDPILIGRCLIHLSMEEDGIERAIAFAAIVAKAKRARSKSQS